MKVLKDTPKPGGKRHVTVEIAADESLLAVHDESFYRLGDPHEDVVSGHILLGAQPVDWCVAEQKWVA